MIQYCCTENQCITEQNNIKKGRSRVEDKTRRVSKRKSRWKSVATAITVIGLIRPQVGMLAVLSVTGFMSGAFGQIGRATPLLFFGKKSKQKKLRLFVLREIFISSEKRFFHLCFIAKALKRKASKRNFGYLFCGKFSFRQRKDFFHLCFIAKALKIDCGLM